MAELEGQIQKANGEIVGLYVADATGTQVSVETVSAAMDNYGWTGGYRILDNASRDIWNGGSTTGSRLITGTPQMWVVDTATMKIVHRGTDADLAYNAVRSLQ